MKEADEEDERMQMKVRLADVLLPNIVGGWPMQFKLRKNSKDQRGTVEEVEERCKQSEEPNGRIKYYQKK